MYKNLILDWSGTLADDFGHTLHATNAVLEKYGVKQMEGGEFRERFRLPYSEFYEEVVPDVALEDLEVHFREAFYTRDVMVEPLPGARAFLEQAKELGIELFVLTSMSGDAFYEQLHRFGWEHFFGGTYAGILDKRGEIKKILQLHGLNAHETAYVGDMVHDVHAAQDGGVSAVSVLSGYDSAMRLAAERPDFIVEDVLKLVALLRRAILSPNLYNSASKRGVEDRIYLEGLEMSTKIGVPDEERAVPQTIRASLEVYPVNKFSSLGEDISKTVNYATLAETMRDVALSREWVLLETLAEKILEVILTQFSIKQAHLQLDKRVIPGNKSVGVRMSKVAI